MILLRKVQTCHTKRRPGEVRARGQLWETRFLIIACPSSGASQPTPNTENSVNFSENRGGRDRPLETAKISCQALPCGSVRVRAGGRAHRAISAMIDRPFPPPRRRQRERTAVATMQITLKLWEHFGFHEF